MNAPQCPECDHRMVEGNIGPARLWSCARCGVTVYRDGPMTDGVRLLLALTQPEAS